MKETQSIGQDFYDLIKKDKIEECKKIIDTNPHILRTPLKVDNEDIHNYFHDAASLVLEKKNKELFQYILDNHLKELQSYENGNFVNSALFCEIFTKDNSEYCDILMNHNNIKYINWNKSIDKSSALIEAIKSQCNYEIISKLMDLGVDPTQSNPYSENAFTSCAKSGDIDVYNIINRNNDIQSKIIDIDIIINRTIQYNNAPMFDAIFKKSSKKLDYLFQLAVDFKTTRILQAIILENSFIPGQEQLNSLTEIITYTYDTKEETEAAVFILDFLHNVKVKFDKFLNSDNQNIWNLAIENSNLMLIEKLLTIPEIINQKDIDGNSPLMFALERRMHKVAELILEHKPNVNLKNKRDDTALIITAKNDMSYLIDPIIALKALTYEKNKKDENALYWSVKNKNFSMTAKLLWAGTPIATNSLTVQNKILTGNIDLTGAVIMDNKNTDEITLNNFKALVDLGFNLNALSEKGYTFPMHFVVNNHIKNFASILECQFDPNQQKDDGNTILMECIKQTNPLFSNLLIKKFGTDIDSSITNELGQNAVDVAIAHSNVTSLWQIINNTNNVTKEMVSQALPVLLESLDYSMELLLETAENYELNLQDFKNSQGEDMWFSAVRRENIEDIKYLILNFQEGPNFQDFNSSKEKIEDVIKSIKNKDFQTDVMQIFAIRKQKNKIN